MSERQSDAAKLARVKVDADVRAVGQEVSKAQERDMQEYHYVRHELAQFIKGYLRDGPHSDLSEDDDFAEVAAMLIIGVEDFWTEERNEEYDLARRAFLASKFRPGVHSEALERLEQYIPKAIEQAYQNRIGAGT